MANIKSAKKRVKTTAIKTLRNKMVKSSLRTALKKVETAINSGDLGAAKNAYAAAVVKIDRAIHGGILHKNTAARKKSRFALRINAMGK